LSSRQSIVPEETVCCKPATPLIDGAQTVTLQMFLFFENLADYVTIQHNAPFSGFVNRLCWRIDLWRNDWTVVAYLWHSGDDRAFCQ